MKRREHPASKELKKYINKDEEIHMVFGISIRYFLARFLTVLFIALIVSFFAFRLWFPVGAFVCFWGLLAIGMLIFNFIHVTYFLTNRRLYKKSGFFNTSLEFVERGKVVDIKILRTFQEKFFWHSGTIMLNTPGGNDYELILEHVANPYKRKRDITAFWSILDSPKNPSEEIQD